MSRRYRWIAALLGLIVIVTISAGVLWSTQSALVRRLVIRQLGSLTNRQATIERFDLDLRRGRLEIAGLRLADRQPGPPFLELERLDMRFAPGSLLRGGLAIRELALRGVRVRIVRSERGELNIPDLGGSGKGAFSVTVDRLTLADGQVAVEDHSRAPVQHWRADDIAVEARGLSTRGGQVPGSARLAANVAGAPVSAEISDLMLAPLHLRGTVDVKNVDATVAGIALPASVVAVVEDARLSVNAALIVDARDGVNLDAQGRLESLTVRNRRTGDPLVSVPSLAITVDGLRTSPSGRAPTLGHIVATGTATVFHARGAAAGRFAIERLRLAIDQAATDQPTPTDQATTPTQPATRTDQATTPTQPATTGQAPKVEQAATTAPSSARVTVTAGFSGGGRLDAEGPLRLAPFATELRGKVGDLDASVLLSYVDLPARLSGTLDSDLAVDVSSSSSGVSSRARGRVTVKRAAVADGAREVARARQIEADGVDIGWPRVAVARIRVVEPVALVERDRSGRVSLAALLAPASPGPTGVSVANLSQASSLTVEIGEFTVVDGTLTLDDASGTAPVRLALGKLQASARNIAWPASSRPVSIDVKAATPDAGTIESTGTVSLDSARVDVRTRVAGAALAPYQGYLPFPVRVQGFAHLDLAIAGSFGATTILTAKGTGALNDLAMGDGDRRIIRVSRVETTGLQYTWPATFAVDRLRVGRSGVRIERRADSTFPLLELFARPRTQTTEPSARPETPAAGREPATPSPARPSSPVPRPSAAHPPASAFSVTVRDAVLEDGRVRFVDGAVSPTSTIDVSDVRLAVRGFSWPARDPTPIELGATAPGGGRVSVKGALDVANARLDGKVVLGGIDLAPAQPYLPVRAHAAAKASADLDVSAQWRPLALTARGSASLGDVTFTPGEQPGIGISRAPASKSDAPPGAGISRRQTARRAQPGIGISRAPAPESETQPGAGISRPQTTAPGAAPAIGISRVEITGLDFASPGKVAIDRLRVQAPRAVVERTRDGTFPLIAFFTSLGTPPGAGPAPEPTTAAAAPPPFQIAIRESRVEDGSGTMIDNAVNPAARFDVTGVRFVARDFAWPTRGPVTMRMRASLPGEGTVRATAQLGLSPTTFDLDVTADGVDLGILRSYVPLRGQVRAKAGATLKVNATTNPFAITARGTATVSGVNISEREQSLLTADRIEATALDYSWPATVKIDRLRVEKPWAVIDRVSGQVPVLHALSSPGQRETRPGAPDTRRRESPGRGERRQERAAPSQPSASSPPLPLQLTLRRAIVDNGTAAIVDAGVDPPARFEITGVRLVLRDLAWPSRDASGFTLRAATPSGGRLEVRGQLRLDTPSIDTKIVLEQADLASLQPLVPIQGRVAGKASADLQVKGPLTPMALSVTGTMAVTDVSFGDAERPLVTAKGVDLAGVAAEWPQRRATVRQIRVREPWILVERDADGTFPLLSLIAPKPARNVATSAREAVTTPDGRTPAGPTGDASRPAIAVEALAVEGGFVRFTDRTTTPRFVEEASRVAVTAQGLGTAPATQSAVTVGARLTGGAQVDLQGTTGPIGGPLFMDVQGTLSGLPLNRANPYLNRLLGWTARQGTIGGTTHFRIRNDHLEADNEVVIGRPLFAPSRRFDEVRERVGVPLDLLVSLLEDSRREIRMSVPVTGTLSSRQFDFGDAVWDAIRRAAINVLALPVSWVGKVFYTEDSRIATISIWPVSFEPGTTQMRRGIDKHAERLATFMRQTPTIAFALKPVMTVEDVDALKRAAVRQRIDTLAPEAGTTDAAAAKLFAERFPGRPAPAEPAAIITELAKTEPASDRALQALATARVALVRQELESKGDVNPSRLRASEGAVPVEASGQGRVEFEMVPDAAPAQ